MMSICGVYLQKGCVCVLVYFVTECTERGNLLVQLQTFWVNGPTLSARCLSCSYRRKVG